MWSIRQQAILSISLCSGRVSPQPQTRECFPFLYCSHGQKQEWSNSCLSPLASPSPSRARQVRYTGGSAATRSSELVSSPSVPHRLACRAVAWAAVRLSGLATQDRWQGIISASQNAMVAGVGVGEALTPSQCVYTYVYTHTNECMQAHAAPHCCSSPSLASCNL